MSGRYCCSLLGAGAAAVPVALVRAGTGMPAAENAASPLEEPLRYVQQASGHAFGASRAQEETEGPAGIASGARPAALPVEEQLAAALGDCRSRSWEPEMMRVNSPGPLDTDGDAGGG